MYNRNMPWIQNEDFENHPFPNGNDYFRNVKHACKKYMNFYVIAQMNDGNQVEGIVEGMDDEGVTMLVPETVEEIDDDRQQFGGYGWNGYDDYNGYGGYRRRYRRYRRRRFPFSVFIFPFFYPYPFYY
ncbi:hypothetical protein JOC86_004477 [Bacillus pakistanensis]|uniref:Uncharacterized protein n=1 Tax=Rossellomorea pakistanensis TaxID=992288 RepID=A0ABS2NJ63_9BACI|nr:hypothetical protein [Bacillus pakistanensis]MBM7587902.1 hypothetical protein [Bacillus pakistanensis]